MHESRILLRVLDPDGRRIPEFERRVELQPLWDLDSLLQQREGLRLLPEQFRIRDVEGCTEIAIDTPSTVLYRVGLQWGSYETRPEDQYCVLRPLGEVRVDIPMRTLGVEWHSVDDWIRGGWARRDAVLMGLLAEGRFGAIRGRLVRRRTDRCAQPKIHVVDAEVPLRRGSWNAPPLPGYLLTEMLFDEGEAEMDWIAVPVRSGRKRVFVVDPAAASWSTELEIIGGQTVDVGVVSPAAATGRFEVQVVDPEGRPVKDVRIHANGRDPAFHGEDGEFQLQLGPWIKEGPEPLILEPIPPESTRLRLEIWRSGGAPTEADVELKDGSYTMTLAPTTHTGKVAGTVVDDRGKRVEGYSVMTEPIRVYVGCGLWPDGRFAVFGLDTSEATVKLKVTCPGYESAILEAPVNAKDLRIVLRALPDGS